MKLIPKEYRKIINRCVAVVLILIAIFVFYLIGGDLAKEVIATSPSDPTEIGSLRISDTLSGGFVFDSFFFSGAAELDDSFAENAIVLKSDIANISDVINLLNIVVSGTDNSTPTIDNAGLRILPYYYVYGQPDPIAADYAGYISALPESAFTEIVTGANNDNIIKLAQDANFPLSFNIGAGERLMFKLVCWIDADDAKERQPNILLSSPGINERYNITVRVISRRNFNLN